MKTTFIKFLDDKHAAEMFISGQAGTGKTTGLYELVEYCIANSIEYVVCAYTHKACDILRLKLPKGANVITLHKWLKKRPTINEHATKVKHLHGNQQQGIPDDATILFLDEYSMLGEKDYTDIGDRQYLKGDDIPNMKAVYVGDPNQLPPITDQQAIYPSGKYNIKLTKIYRQSGDSELLYVLTQLVNFIEGAKPEPLVENDDFIRGVDLAFRYHDVTRDKVFLAYTNKAVQDWNIKLAGKDKPNYFDTLFSPTIKKHYVYVKDYLKSSCITLPFNDEVLELNSKYKTLEHLNTMEEVSFAMLATENTEHVFAYVFGHYNYKVILEELGKVAVSINNQIEHQYKTPAKQWAFKNKTRVLAKKRAKAWRDYFTFKNCVICLDFPYAMTVHKSQGSTFDTVFLDTKDLGKCAEKDYQQYLRLMYVAISRASNKVYTN